MTLDLEEAPESPQGRPPRFGRIEAAALNRIAAQVPGVLYQYVLRTDGTSAFPYASPGIWDVYEVTPEQVKADASAVFDRLHPDDVDTVVAAINASAKSLKPWIQEYRVQLPEKGVRWLRGEARPVREDDGTILWHGHITDITERRLAEDAIHASESRLKLALEATGDGVWDWRIKENQVHHNLKWCELLGVDESLLVHPLDDFVALLHPEDRTQVIERVQACLRGEGSYRSEHRMVTSDGTVLWVEDRGQVLERDADGAPVRMIGSIRDVSDRVRAERERLAALRRTDTFFTLALDLLCIVSPDGAFIQLNPAWTQVLGYPIEALRGRPSTEHCHPEDLERTMQAADRLAQGEHLIGFTNRYRHADGRYRLLEWRARHQDGFIFAAGRDVTEIHERQEALRCAKAAAERASQAKSTFLANMSHEIRTPMNGVLGAAELLSASGLELEQKELVGTIRSSGEALLAIINDILDFSRVEAGKLSIEALDFDLELLLREIVAPFRLKVRGSPVQVRLEVPSDLIRWRIGDPGRVRQIVTNLLGNAIKFTKAGEVAVVASACPELGRDGVAIAVQDTGIGIPRDRQRALFQPFEQVDATTARRFGGTGLGLAISGRLAELMGGVIELQSEVGVGSTFTVRLPLPRATGPAPVVTDEELTPARGVLASAGLSVLLAEDNPVNQRVATKMLDRLGVSVDVASDGLEAVACAKAGRYDLILMDVQMPGMDGYEATAQIRADERARERPRVPIVALTANAMSADRDQAFASDMDEHVSKPLRMADLEAVLRRILGGEAREGRLTDAVAGPL